jgi:hypothetical protein
MRGSRKNMTGYGGDEVEDESSTPVLRYGESGACRLGVGGSGPPQRGRERAASTDTDMMAPPGYCESEEPRWHTLCGNVGGYAGSDAYAALVHPTRTGGTEARGRTRTGGREAVTPPAATHSPLPCSLRTSPSSPAAVLYLSLAPHGPSTPFILTSLSGCSPLSPLSRASRRLEYRPPRGQENEREEGDAGKFRAPPQTRMLPRAVWRCGLQLSVFRRGNRDGGTGRWGGIGGYRQVLGLYVRGYEPDADAGGCSARGRPGSASCGACLLLPTSDGTLSPPPRRRGPKSCVSISARRATSPRRWLSFFDIPPRNPRLQ